MPSSSKPPSKCAKLADPVAAALTTTSLDRGHRLGNFWNYPTFNPASTRLDLMPASFFTSVIDGAAGSRFTYADLGCNEGDLTLPFFSALLSHLPSPGLRAAGRAVGVDIDAELVERAKERAKDEGNGCVEFRAGNVADSSVLAAVLSPLSSPSPPSSSSSSSSRLSLISVFSTTMWLHVHLGDVKFKDFLRDICGRARMLLVEPQPKKCYANVNKRLKKMKQPTVDLTGLAMLEDLEGSIEAVILENGFERVVHGGAEGETPWGRSVYLYKWMGEGKAKEEKPAEEEKGKKEEKEEKEEKGGKEEEKDDAEEARAKKRKRESEQEKEKKGADAEEEAEREDGEEEEESEGEGGYDSEEERMKYDFAKHDMEGRRGDEGFDSDEERMKLDFMKHDMDNRW